MVDNESRKKVDKCQSITRNGTQCRRKPFLGGRYCWQHESTLVKWFKGSVSIIGAFTVIATIFSLFVDVPEVYRMAIGSNTEIVLPTHTIQLSNTPNPSVPLTKTYTITLLRTASATLTPSIASSTLIPTSTISSNPTRTSLHSLTPEVADKPTAVSPIKSAGVGKLLVQASVVGCDGKGYSVTTGEETTTGSVGSELELASGVYDVTFFNNFGEPLVRKDITIHKDETTMVDFTQELGTLKFEGYPDIGAPKFIISPGDTSTTHRIDVELCGLAGAYTITLATYRRVCSFCISLGGCCNNYYYALFPENIEFNVKVNTGKTTIVNPDAWPKKLGQFMFEPSHIPRNIQVEDIQNGIQFDGNLNENLTSGYWMIVGEYRLTMLEQPFTGTEYKFEIKEGSVTILQLPSSD